MQIGSNCFVFLSSCSMAAMASTEGEHDHTTDDGVRLRYAVHGREGPAVVLVSCQPRPPCRTRGRCMRVAARRRRGERRPPPLVRRFTAGLAVQSTLR